ncbi:hypothetical protein CA54_10590 [Symmachiella macrocystis]|uniref:Type II secretion system protein GspG C-terminal domain-containing protein n=1 Tax=Symmachiella macrocystis TaxID=2527985 RepID=A0A5C6BLQ5_9PLAN|nr:hypothetical protein [Symmachiella macrocystis]TWU12236.1 hypothetical protein CA54_10590 [Symmachiella macrocystis]
MMPDSPKRFWTLRKRLCFVFGLILFAPLAVAGYVWFTANLELAAQLAELRAQGMPTTVTELTEFYTVPNGVNDTTDLWIEAIESVQAAGVYERGENLPFVGDGDLTVPPPGQPWPELDASRALIEELVVEFSAIRQAAAAGGQVRFPIDFTQGLGMDLPQTVYASEVEELLQLSAHVNAHMGDDSAALEDIKTLFKLSDALRGEPVLISNGVRNTIHNRGCETIENLLPYCEWSDVDLASLQWAVQSARFKDELARGVAGERVVLLDAIAETSVGPWRTTNLLEGLRLLDLFADQLPNSWPNLLTSLLVLDAEFDTYTESPSVGVARILVALDSSGVKLAANSGASSTARQRCTITALALQRHRLKYGQLPDSLDQMDPQLLGPATQMADALIDPFDGQPLRYQVQESQVIIYSVGINGVDDGGDLQTDANGDLMDIGFTVKK